MASERERRRRLSLSPILVLLLLPLLSGCGDWLFGPVDGLGPVEEITELPRALTASEQAVIGGSNGFGFDLLREVASEEGPGENVVLSPLSASMALGLTLEGAEGRTFDELRTTLGFGDLGREDVRAAYRELIDLFYGLDPTVEFRIANSAWYREGFDVEESYEEALREHFDADIRGLDFSSPEAAPTINGWVAEQTDGRIEAIVEDPIDPLTMLFLINAIYFDGAWTTTFDPDRTAPSDFRLRDGSTVQVSMMKREPSDVQASFGRDFTALELPYGGGAYAMTIVLPPEDEELHDFVAALDGERWDEIVTGLTEQRAAVHLPRFRLDDEKSLNAPLQELGIRDAFDAANADFGRIHRQAREIGLHVKEVKQKTWIDVNEEGTEAAAVTSVEMGPTSAPPAIRVDRPFLFALRERLSGTLLFLGVVENPAE